MKQLILIRHSVRLDKQTTGKLDTSSWLLNYDPPLDLEASREQMSHIAWDNIKGENELIIHSSPYNRCIQTAELLLKYHNGVDPILRVDQLLSEWLNFNFNSNFLPPNDNGISLLNNINQYLYQNDSQLHRDMTWDSYKFGSPGEYGEDYESFRERCLVYLNKLMDYYENSNKVIIVISHGAVIALLLQIILNRPLFKEIPLLTPIFLNKLNQNLFQLNSNIEFLNKFNLQIYKLKNMKLPIEYQTNMFIDENGDSDYTSDEEEEKGIVFQVTRSRSNTTGSIRLQLKKLPIQPCTSEKNFNDLKRQFFMEEPEQITKQIDKDSSDEEFSLNFGVSNNNNNNNNNDKEIINDDKAEDRKHLEKLLFTGSDKNLYKINEEEDYWFGFNK